MSLPAPFRRYAGLALLCASAAAFSAQAPLTANTHADDNADALVGEMMFNADLLTALDKLCPRDGPQPLWHTALPRLPAKATTPDLQDLSRRLGADAGRRMVQETGGCASAEFREAYEESRENFDDLIERWQQRAP